MSKYRPTPTLKMSRSDIRANMRSRRRSLSPSEQDLSAQALLNNLQTQSWYQTAEAVAAYLSYEGEIDLTLVIQDLVAQGKTLSLPKLDNNKGLMQFCDWQPNQPLISNRYGILEPDIGLEPDMGRLRPLTDISLILAPLVAFDRAGTRIGMGGGYYDRLLGGINSETRPLVVGVAYQFQQLDGITAEQWDAPLDAVVTDKEVIPISARLTHH